MKPICFLFTILLLKIELWNFRVLFQKTTVLIICIKRILVHQVGDRGMELDSSGASQLLYHLFILINSRQEPHTVFFHQFLGA